MSDITTADCATCRFVFPDNTCRAHPPSAVTGLMGQTQVVWAWPSVGPDDWCGEFQQAISTPLPPPTTSTPPTSLTPPIVTGNDAQPAICMCSQGVWSSDAIYFNYQWQSEGVDIDGATGNYYQSTASDVGNVLTCTVTAQNSYGSASATSTNQIGPVV